MTKRFLALLLAACLLAAVLPLSSAFAAEPVTPKTSNEAVAEMTWGVNLADLYIADIQPEEGDTNGYDNYTVKEIYDLCVAIWFWDDSFEWISTYPTEKQDTIQISVPIPTYDAHKAAAAEQNGCPFFTIRCGDTTGGKNYKITLSDCKITKNGTVLKNTADFGSNGVLTAQGTTSADGDINNWHWGFGSEENGWAEEISYFAGAWDESTQKMNTGASSEYNGATFTATLTVDTAATLPTESKVDHYFEHGRTPIDQEELTDLFLAEGANVFRLPVTWTWFVDNQTFEIDEEWLAAVKTEVDYILSKGAYCILDMHNDYMKRSFVATKNQSTGQWENFKWTHDWMYDQYDEYVDARFKEVWRQIAEYFKDCSDKLIFETCNEPAMIWDVSHETGGIGGYGDYDTWIEYQYTRPNELNQLFVDTVRGTGGKNETRLLCLAVAEFNQHQHLNVQTESINNQALNTYGLTIPEHDNYLIAQIHSYSEMENPGYGTYAGCEAETDKLFHDVAKFKTNHPNVPVIVGEVGISHAAGNIGSDANKAAAANKVAYFYQKATENDVPCLWWEDYFPVPEGGSGNTYWIYDKTAKEWGRPEILQAIQDNTRKLSQILSLTAAEGTLTASLSTNQTADVYCAFYDDGNQMLGVFGQSLTTGFQQQSFPVPASAARCKVFLLSPENIAPLCEAKEKTLGVG